MAENWNPWIGERVGRAWRAALEQLEEGEWRGAPALLAVMVDAGPIEAKTAENLLRHGHLWGALLERRPGGSRRFERRLYRISPTAASELLHDGRVEAGAPAGMAR